MDYISSGIIVLAYVSYFILYLINKKRVTNKNGFDTVKEVISEYNNINVILTNSVFTSYNIKRKIIKMSKRSYYGKSIGDIAISLIEAGILEVDNYKNKIINLCRNVFSTMKLFYIFPLLAIVINTMTHNISDARVSIIFISIFMILHFIYINVKNSAYTWLSDNVKEIDKKEMVFKYINIVSIIDKLIFIGEGLMIIRFVGIMMS